MRTNGSAPAFRSVRLRPSSRYGATRSCSRLVEQPVPLDLLIVDEAHHMRNVDANTYRLGNALVNASDAVLFLTATPLNLRTDDLFNLVNMLAPDEFQSR